MWLYDHASVDRYDLSFANPIWWRPLRRPRTEASARREGRRKTRVDPDRPVTEGWAKARFARRAHHWQPTAWARRARSSSQVETTRHARLCPPLYGAFGVKQRSIISTSFFLSFVPSLCSTGAIIPSSRPALRSRRRAGAVKVGRRTPTLRHAPPLPPHLDSFEPDGTLGAIGMTIRGELAFGRGSIAPQPCIRWVQGPEP